MNALVQLVYTGMVIFVSIVRTVKFLTKKKIHVNVLQELDGTDMAVRQGLIVIMERNGMFLHFLVNALPQQFGMALFVRTLFLVKMDKYMMEKSVFVLKELIGMVNGVNLMDVLEDKYGMDLLVNVNLNIISMEKFAYFVSMAKNGTF